MNQKVNSVSIDGENSVIFNLRLPTHCPHCGRFIQPKTLSAFHLTRKTSSYGTSGKRYEVFITLLCPGCESAFISKYSSELEKPLSDNESVSLSGTYPTFHSKPRHQDNITKRFPEYIKIYDEAYFAEESDLLKICGMGYRKALEFLVKDYAILTHSNDKEAIENSMLGKCIENYIDNPKIQDLAKASAWVGNDQTHYVLKNGNYGIKELKAFITAIESFISAELEVMEAASLLNSGN